MIRGAAGWVWAQREPLNAINVYPVPDGDTGANLGRTLAAANDAAQTALSESDPSAREIAAAAAQGALLGGRGSSGVIAGQWLRGFAQGLPDDPGADPIAALAAALRAAAQAARDAVAEPRDGTMISTARDIAQAADIHAASTPVGLLATVVDAAYDSVEDTPRFNLVLADAGVVDAGARGLEFMLRGMLAGLSGGHVPDSAQTLGQIDPDWLARRLDGDSEVEGFCTELIVADVAPDQAETLRETLAGVDETLMLAPAGDDRHIRIHIHTNEPELAYQAAHEAGQIRSFRAIDMRAQAARTHEDETDPAVVAVVQGAGFVALFRELGAQALISGGAADNPSVDMLLSAAESVQGSDVILLPNHHNVVPAAIRAADLAESATLHIIPAESQPAGVAALAARIGGVPPEDAAAEMIDGIDTALIGQVARAARTITGDIPLQQDQPFAMLDDHIVAAADTIPDAALALAAQMTARLPDAALFTLYAGEDVDPADADALAEAVADASGHEVDLIDGGQPHYPWLLALE